MTPTKAPSPARAGAMTAPGCSRIARLLARILSLLLVAAVIAAIFALTAQSPEGTSELSQVATNAVVGAAPGEGGSLASDAVAFEETGAISTELAKAWKLVRRIAHVVEFAALGASTALACLAWLSGRWPLRRMACLAVAFCAANSLVDQIHKLFVPGREFDVLDLAFDATGYLVGIAVVLLAVRALWRLRDCRRGGVDWGC